MPASAHAARLSTFAALKGRNYCLYWFGPVSYNTFYLMHVSTFLQQHVPDHLLGRVMSLYSLCWNLLPLGGLLAGALAAAVDARFAVLFGGAMVAANALLLLTSSRLRAISQEAI